MGETMHRAFSLLAVVLFCTGCPNAAGDCRKTLSCDPPDAAVVYVEGDAGLPCDGVCVPPPTAGFGWSPPFLFWRGEPGKMPAERCPPDAPTAGQMLYASPDDAPSYCPICSCAPSTGMCTLPGAITVDSSPMCSGDGGVPFDPPSGWDGGCTTNDAITTLQCDGGACSAAVEAMVPLDSCIPVIDAIPKKVIWAINAYSCTGGTNQGACADSGEVCIPGPPTPPPGFGICTSKDGDDPLIECPPDYPTRYVLYLGAEDTRNCSPCACEPPQGSSCSSLVSLYSDDACAMQVGSVTATSTGSMCVDVPPGSLGSKAASPPKYNPGTCQPTGGEATGSLLPLDPFTFCCTN